MVAHRHPRPDLPPLPQPVLERQERFILPVIPALIALGVIGWDLVAPPKPVVATPTSAESVLWGLFRAVNVALLAVSIPYEAKRHVCTRWISSRQGAQSFAMVQVDSGAMPPVLAGHPTRSTTAGRSGPPVADVVSGSAPSSPSTSSSRAAHLAESVQEYKTTCRTPVPDHHQSRQDRPVMERISDQLVRTSIPPWTTPRLPLNDS